MEPIREQGYFFLPHNTEVKIPGILTYDINKGTNLELIGSFKDDTKDPKVILGYNQKGTSFSLYNNFRVRKTSSDGYYQSNYYGNYLFKGIHFQYKRDLKYRNLSVNYNLLNEWLDIRDVIDIDTNFDTNETKVFYKQPSPKVIKLSNDLDLRISSGYWNNYPIRGLNEFVLKHSSYLTIQSKERTSLEKLLDYQRYVQSFLTLLTQKTIYPKDVMFKYRVRGKKETNNANIYFSIRNPKDYSDKNINRLDFITTFDLIEELNPNVFYKWFSMYNKMETIINEYCSYYHSESMYHEEHFLSLAKCLEAFHREFRKKKKVDNIDRYKELFEEGRDAFNWFVKVRSKNKVCERIKEIRNILTHNKSSKKQTMENIREIVRLKNTMNVIFTTAVLKELDLHTKEIKELYSNSNVIRYKLY